MRVGRCVFSARPHMSVVDMCAAYRFLQVNLVEPLQMPESSRSGALKESLQLEPLKSFHSHSTQPRALIEPSKSPRRTLNEPSYL